MRRWGKRLSWGVLVLLLLALAGVGAFWLTLPQDRLAVLEPGALTVEPDATGTYDVGALRVSVTDDGVRIEEDGRVVWESPDGRSFVTAAQGEVDVEEHRGYFWPSVEHDTDATDQLLDEVTPLGGDRLELSGLLDRPGSGARWTAVVEPREDGGAVMTVDVPDAHVVQLASGRTSGAAVHGFGEQFDDFDLDGRLVPVLVREQGVGRGEQPLTFLADLTNRSAGGTSSMTYAAWSSYVTGDLRGVALDPDDPASHAFAVADTRAADRVGLEVWAPRITAELTAADSSADLVAQRHIGEPALPDWTQRGALVGIQGGTDEVRRRVADLQDAGVLLAGVWLQDWTGRRTTSFGDRLWWTWQLDRERYPEWEQLVADLRREGIAVTTYVNPFLVDAAAKGDPDLRNLWAEARDAGYLVAAADGSPYLLDQGGLDASLVDLTDPAARDWLAGVIADEVLAHGVVGLMADFAEGLPFDAQLHEGAARELHNAWPGLWAQTVADAC